MSLALAQRKAQAAPSPVVATPRLHDSGRPLDGGIRTEMERGFARDFSAVRVHDDARAHDHARTLGALAYATGNDVVFGEGRYRPETPGGRALIAHELAHTVQQGGVQMKADGPVPVSANTALEVEADRAAAIIVAGGTAPSLSQATRPALFRAKDPPAAGPATTTSPALSDRLPPGMTEVVEPDAPPGSLIVQVDSFVLPLEKGGGDWVHKAYKEASDGGRLTFSPIIQSDGISAYLEGGEDYKSVWLSNFGFASTTAMATAILDAEKSDATVKEGLAKPGVRKLVQGLKKSLKDSVCDIDHIVEKQIGGTSIPSNLQLLTSGKNQKSGGDTYLKLKSLVNDIRAENMRGKKVKKLQLRIKSATVPPGVEDPSSVVEGMLRAGLIKGNAKILANAEMTAVALNAGGMGETVHVRKAGATEIDASVRRIVPGMRLTDYTRGQQGESSKIDHVDGELDSRAIGKAKASKKETAIRLTATLEAAGAAPIGAAAAGKAAEKNEAASQQRKLAIPAGPQKIKFYYPYLSPGTLTSAWLDAKGELHGEGIIEPSVRFLNVLKIRYGPDQLDLIAPIDTNAINSSAVMRPLASQFRFTEGSLSIDLVRFKPDGRLAFTMGPATKPLLAGEVNATVEGGAFVATGKLKPAGKIPGIGDAAGEVKYHSEKGWSGSLKATSAADAKFKVDTELGFRDEGGRIAFYGMGGITTQIRQSTLSLRADWHGGEVGYSGKVTVPKPLPLVDEVELKGGYSRDLLDLEGKAAIKWKGINSTMTVRYRRKDGEEGKFSGKADVAVKTDKADGKVGLQFDEAGNYSGSGSLSYQLTKDLRPKLNVDLTKDHRVKVSGEVKVGDIALTKEWPKPGGGEITIIKGIGAKFIIPTPVTPAVNAFGEVRGSLGLNYGVGPVVLRGLALSGELYPLEDDPQVKAKLTGELAVPARGEIRGTFGAYIGAEVLAGAVGVKGGVDITPSIGITGKGAAKIEASYESGGFDFSAEAYAEGSLNASLRVDLKAQIFAGYGLWSHDWVYPAASVTRKIGPDMRLTLGKIAYARTGEITWPNLSQIEVTPKDIDPKQLLMDLLGETKAVEKT